MLNGAGNIFGHSYYNGNADLEPRAMNHIVVDGINRTKGKPMLEAKPANELVMAMLLHLTKPTATGGDGYPCIVRRRSLAEADLF